MAQKLTADNSIAPGQDRPERGKQDCDRERVGEILHRGQADQNTRYELGGIVKQLEVDHQAVEHCGENDQCADGEGNCCPAHTRFTRLMG